MKTTKQIAAIALLFGLLATGCKGRGNEPDPPPECTDCPDCPDCPPEPYPADIAMEQFSIAGSGYVWNLFECNGEVDCTNTKLFVVNSCEEMKRYLSEMEMEESASDDCPDIDFTKQTLLLASGIATSGLSGIAGKLQQLSPAEYRLDVALTLNRATIVEPWVIAFITDKLEEENTVGLNATEVKGGDNESLVGTWQLIGYVETGTEQIKEFGISENGRRYCVQFSADNTVSSATFTDYLAGIYEIGNFNSIRSQGHGYLTMYGKMVKFYAVSGNQLKLYYQETLSTFPPLYDYMLLERWDDGEVKPLQRPPVPPGVVDWEGYNDVGIFALNYSGKCGEHDLDKGKTIKAAGWLPPPGWYEQSSSFYLFKEPNKISPSDGAIYVIFEPNILKTKLENSDLNRKCYVTGTLYLSELLTCSWCAEYPIIKVTHPDDIYFE